MPFIWNTIKNIAVPNSHDSQEISSSQWRANGARFVSTPLFGWQCHSCDLNIIFHFAPRGVASCVYEHIALTLEMMDLT